MTLTTFEVKLVGFEETYIESYTNRLLFETVAVYYQYLDNNFNNFFCLHMKDTICTINNVSVMQSCHINFVSMVMYIK